MNSRNKSILVIDDEEAICTAFERFFSHRGWQVASAGTAAGGLEAWRTDRQGAVFLDVRLPDRNGLDLLSELAADGAAVIMITAYGGLQSVVQAIQHKAMDYLVKPIDLDRALELAQRACEAAPTTPADSSESSQLLIGNSPPMQEVYKLIARSAASASPVLIQGDTGTGKELVARAIHQFSRPGGGPFVAINCGAIPQSLIESELFGHVRGAFTGAEQDRPGKFEAANGGCLLLDEIGDLPLGVQVKLLRVLDGGQIERVGSSRPVKLNVRILAAANKDLAHEVSQGRFRPDLYYRLAVLHIALPPLRDRKADIAPLAEHFLRRLPDGSNAPTGLSDQALKVCMAHDWPGNVRELRNAIEHAAAVAPGRAIMPDDLPASVIHRRNAVAGPDGIDRELARTVLQFASALEPDADKHGRTIEHVERTLIEHAMRLCGNNQSEAAAYLGLHRNTLRNKLRQFGLQ